MATNIEISYLQEDGTYETLIPLSSFANMIDSLTESQIPNLSMSKITSGNLAGSRISGSVSSASSATSATTATRLSNSRTIQTNLASTSSASFNGSANILPGITGTLGLSNGGTGVTSLSALKSSLGISDSGKITQIDYFGTGQLNVGVTITHNSPNAICFFMFGYYKQNMPSNANPLLNEEQLIGFGIKNARFYYWNRTTGVSSPLTLPMFQVKIGTIANKFEDLVIKNSINIGASSPTSILTWDDSIISIAFDGSYNSVSEFNVNNYVYTYIFF